MIGSNYFSWRNEMRAALDDVKDAAEIMCVIEQQTIKLGLKFYALFIQHPIPFTRPKTFIYSNYPSKWVRLYENEDFAAIDPVINYCKVPGKIFLWNDRVNCGDSRVLMTAREYGICSGFSCSTMALNRATGILSMASHEPVEKIRLVQEDQLKLQHLVVLVLESLQRVKDISMSVMNMELSQRELEILKWTAEGKTSAEISLILCISENTVNFHQKNMQKRFNAPNRTQVASYAAAMGLI